MLNYFEKYLDNFLLNVLNICSDSNFILLCLHFSMFLCECVVFEMAINRKRVEGEIRRLCVLIPMKSWALGVRWGDRPQPL